MQNLNRLSLPKALTSSQAVLTRTWDDFSDCSSLESEDEQQHKVKGQSQDEANPFEYGEACCDRAERAISMAREQIRKGNEAFMKRFLPSLTPLLTLEEEADRKQKRRSMTQTWGKYKHSATMFLT